MTPPPCERRQYGSHRHTIIRRLRDVELLHEWPFRHILSKLDAIPVFRDSDGLLVAEAAFTRRLPVAPEGSSHSYTDFLADLEG